MTAVLIRGLAGGGPPIDAAKKELSYPLYGADFDPLNHHFLIVGGGGGSSSTGVPNRISLLDTSHRSEIKEVADIELAHDEDSVVSLAVAHSDPQALVAYAGINGSIKDQEKGRNEHFRSFKVPLPAKKKKATDDAPAVSVPNTVAPTQALVRTAIFRTTKGTKSECYQRILRLSPPILESSAGEKTGTQSRILKKRLATIASGLATQNEIVTLRATEGSSPPQIISRINLEKSEASDADIASVDDTGSSYALAYATDTELYLQQLGDGQGSVNSDPVQVYETISGPVGRSKIRALRFLSARYILLLQNRPNRSGVELVVLKLSKDFAQSQQSLVKYIKGMKQAVGLDACALSKGQDQGQQFVVAVAGQDCSLQIHTLEWKPGQGMSKFHLYADIEDLHKGPITRVTFSNFISPTLPITGQTLPQYLRLATVGVDKSVIVQTLPLSPDPATGSGKTMPRYVLETPSEWRATFFRVMMTVNLLVLAVALLISLLEFRGVIAPTLGVAQYLPQKWHDNYGKPYPYANAPPGPVIPEAIPAIESVIDRIKLSEATAVIEKMEEMQSSVPSVDDIKDKVADLPSVDDIKEKVADLPSVEEVKDQLVDLVSQTNEQVQANQAVIIRDLEHLGGELSAELKHEAEIVREGTLKKWESLTKKEQKTWKQKLKSAGQWTEQQGEAVLKGVFFGQLGAVVAGVVGG